MSTFNTIQGLTVLAISAVFLAIILLIWHYFWLKPYPLSLPTPENLHNAFPTQYYHIDSPIKAFKYLYLVLFSQYSSGFWTHYCGLEAFFYVAFMRNAIIIAGLIFLITFGFGIPYSAYTGTDVMNSFSLTDTTYKVYIQVFFVGFFAFLYYFRIKKLKDEVFQGFLLFSNKNLLNYQLNSRTLLLKGLDKSQSSRQTQEKLHELFENQECFSMIVPEISKIMSFQAKRQEILLKLAISRTNPNLFTHCFFKLREKTLQKKLNTLEFELHRLMSDDSRFSGLIFVYFHDPEVYRQINPSFFCTDCSRKRVFLEFQQGITTESMPSPIDICWRNLEERSKLSFVRSFVLNFLMVLVILFLTTPISLLEIVDIQGFLAEVLENAEFLPGNFTSLLQKCLSPLLILVVNAGLLYLIKSLVFLKRNSRLSRTQQEIFTLSVIYLLFNNFVIPGLSLTGAESIFTILSHNFPNFLDNIYSTFYLKDTGSMFILLLLEAGVFTFSFMVLRVEELVDSYFSRALVLERRAKFLDEQEIPLRNPRDLFNYGYSYALNLVFLFIVLVFSTTVPAVSLTGTLFFLLKLCGDCFEIVSLHRKEIDSASDFVESVLRFCCGFGVFFEILMMGYYAVSGFSYHLMVIVVIIVVSAYYSWEINRVSAKSVGEIDAALAYNSEQIWKNNYRIPYI